MGITDEIFETMIEGIRESQGSMVYLGGPLNSEVLFELYGDETRILLLEYHGKTLNGDEQTETEKWYDTIQEAVNNYTIDGIKLCDACKMYNMPYGED